MNFYLFNENTCTRVKLFGEDVRKAFLLNGISPARSFDEADIILVNTCSFLKTKSDYFLDFLSEINGSIKQSQKVAVIGCLGGTNRKEILEINDNIIIFRRDLSEIMEYFKFTAIPEASTSEISCSISPQQEFIYRLNKYILHSRHLDYRLKRDSVCYIQMSVGCKGNCSYCSEKFTTKLKSRPISEIIEAVKDGIKRGYTLFGLSSDDASAYGSDIGASLDELLKELIKFKEDIYFTIPEFNPQGLTESVMKSLADPKFLYITIPVQSGSQKILNLMRRPYEIDSVVEKVRKIKLSNQQLMVNTHIIVGFPGESGEDFKQTVRLLETGLFDRVKVFMYSERPGTDATKFDHKIPQHIKEKRRDVVLQTIRWNNMKKMSLTNLILNLEQIKE